jgi:signal transduction histidine kinase
MDQDLLAACLLHEMRHPLMGIVGGMELLARKVPDAASLREFELLQQQALRLEELFRTWQAVFSSGGPKLETFRVDQSVQRAVFLLSPRLQRLGRRFSVAPAAAPVVAVGAPAAFLHAITNVIVNAADAVEPDGRVQVRVVAQPDRVEVRVSDDGPGIAPEVQARLFQPKATTKPEGKGSGLGLYIARAAMERAGGGVRVAAADDPERASWARTEFVIDLRGEGAP